MRQGILTLALAVSLAPAAADAGIYKCRGADGTVTYSQRPCSPNAEEVAVESRRSVPAGTTDCAHASHFADSVAWLMLQGLDKDEAIQEYGGPDALSAGAARLVNYVYLYDGTNGLSRDRLTALARAQCESGALGDVSCAELPVSYTRAGGGCEAEFRAREAEPKVDVFARNRERAMERTREAAALRAAQGEKMLEEYAAREAVRKCREPIQRELNNHQMAIDLGAHPSQRKHEMKRLRRQLSECQ